MNDDTHLLDVAANCRRIGEQIDEAPGHVHPPHAIADLYRIVARLAEEIARIKEPLT